MIDKYKRKVEWKAKDTFNITPKSLTDILALPFLLFLVFLLSIPIMFRYLGEYFENRKIYWIKIKNDNKR